MKKIDSKEDLINYFNEGSKKEKNLGIGVENEKFLFNKDNKRVDFKTISDIFNLTIQMHYSGIIGIQLISMLTNNIGYISTVIILFMYIIILNMIFFNFSLLNNFAFIKTTVVNLSRKFLIILFIYDIANLSFVA